jgi:peptide subunit release factor 1 (eRF1)
MINLFDSNPYNGHSFMNDLKKEFDKNMTPKEEAENLVNSFLKDKKFQFGFREVRKECALIAVDEIIIALNFHQWQNTKQIDYYIEVRQEIENL